MAKGCRDEAREALDVSTLRRILDNTYDEIFVIDGAQKVVYVNPACERHYGVKASEFIGKPMEQLNELGYWSPAITPVVFAEKRQVTFNQKTSTGKELVTTATPLLDEHGDLELVIFNVRDFPNLEQRAENADRVAVLLRRYKKEVVQLRRKATKHPQFIAHSEAMHNVLELAQQIAPVDSNILILGESGTGKGVLAKYIHRLSGRSEGPFMAINCGAIPEHLLETELFGYAGGAFTGAERGGKVGLIEVANQGTLFLDEIAEMSPMMQVKLLQFLQDFQFMPVGGRRVKRANVRVIAATNRDLAAGVRDGTFRKDLYYRLRVIEIVVPPLRERREDIIPLVHHFMERLEKKHEVSHRISQECLAMLEDYSWPGNVRELENLMERLFVTARLSDIDEGHLARWLNTLQGEGSHGPPTSHRSLDRAVEEVERNLVTSSYEKHGSSRKVARDLAISQTKASRLIRKYCGS